MFATIVSGLRVWRVSLCGAIIAGLLLGVPFSSNPESQCFAKGQGGGGHHFKGHKGHKARNKRHGPKRHHAGHHSAKKHRHAKRREHHPHASHPTKGTDTKYVKDVKHVKDVTDVKHVKDVKDVVHHHNGWDYYWGHHVDLGPDVVGPAVVTPSVTVKRAFIVKLYAPGDGKNHFEKVVGSNHDTVKERVLEKYSGADFKNIHEKAVVGGEDVYVVKFSTPGDGKNYIEDIVASTDAKAKEKVLEKHSGAVFKSVEVKPVINAP